MGIRIFIFLSGKLLYFFLACVTIRTNFLKCFAVRAVGNRKFLSSMWSATLLSQVSNKAASSVDKEKFASGILKTRKLVKDLLPQSRRTCKINDKMHI